MQSDSEYESVGLSDVEEPGIDDASNGHTDTLDMEFGDGEDFLEKIPAKPAKMSMAARMAAAREATRRRTAAATAVAEVREDEEQKEARTKKRRKAGEESEIRQKSLEAAEQRRRKQDRKVEEQARHEASEANERRAAFAQRMKKEAPQRKRAGEKSPSQSEKKSGKKASVAKRGPGRPKKRREVETPLPESDLEDAVESEAEDLSRLNAKGSQKVTSRGGPKENDISDAEYESDDDLESSEADNDLAENIEAALRSAKPAHVKSPLSGAAKRAREEKLRKEAALRVDMAANKPQEVAVVAKPPEKRKRGRPRKNPIPAEAAAHKGVEAELSQQVERTRTPQPYQSPTRNARKQKLGQDVGVIASQQMSNDGERGIVGKELDDAGTQAGTAVVSPETFVNIANQKGKPANVSAAKRASLGVKRAGIGKRGSSKTELATRVKQAVMRGGESAKGAEGVGMTGVEVARSLEIGGVDGDASLQRNEEEGKGTGKQIGEATGSSVRDRTRKAMQKRTVGQNGTTADIQEQAPQGAREVGKVLQGGMSKDSAQRNTPADVTANGMMTEGAREEQGNSGTQLNPVHSKQKGTAIAKTLDAVTSQKQERSTKRRKTTTAAARAKTPAATAKNGKDATRNAVGNQRDVGVVDLTTLSPELDALPPKGLPQPRRSQDEANAGTGSNVMEGVPKPSEQALMQQSAPQVSGEVGSTKTLANSVARGANEAAVSTMPSTSALPAETAARDVGASWAVVAVTMLERLQRQYVEFKRMEAQTINVSLESLRQGEILPSTFSAMNSWLSLEERRDLKRQRLCSAIETARQKLVHSQERCLTEFAKDVADALDEANNLEQTTLGDILKKDRRLGDALVGFTPRSGAMSTGPSGEASRRVTNGSAVAGEGALHHAGESVAHEPTKRIGAEKIGTTQLQSGSQPVGYDGDTAPAATAQPSSRKQQNATPKATTKPRHTKSGKGSGEGETDPISVEKTAAKAPAKARRDPSLPRIMNLTDMKKFVGNAYEKLGLNCPRSATLLKICEKQGGLRLETIFDVLPTSRKTLTARIESLKHQGYLIETILQDSEGQVFKVYTTSNMIADKR